MTLRSRLLRVALFALAALAASTTFADVYRPAYLELREVGADRYDVLWKVPAQGEDLRLAIDVRFPAGTLDVEPRRATVVADAHLERWTIERPGGLVGARIEIVGRAAGVTDVLARIERLDGTSQVESLAAGHAAFTVLPSPGLAETARTYLALGIEHILGGLDHLLFVLGLLLIVGGVRRIALRLPHSLSRTASHSRRRRSASCTCRSRPSRRRSRSVSCSSRSRSCAACAASEV